MNALIGFSEKEGKRGIGIGGMNRSSRYPHIKTRFPADVAAIFPFSAALGDVIVSRMRACRLIWKNETASPITENRLQRVSQRTRVIVGLEMRISNMQNPHLAILGIPQFTKKVTDRITLIPFDKILRIFYKRNSSAIVDFRNKQGCVNFINQIYRI